jgi:hypothetical protein
MLSTTEPDRVDRTPKQSSRQSYHVETTPTPLRRPGSPLKQEVLASPVPDSPGGYYYSPSASPTFSRDDRAFHQAQRWTVLSREAEADEVSILSITSEEKNYYAALVPDEPNTPKHQSSTDSHISGFSGEAFAEDEYEYNNLQKEREESVERFSEVEYDGPMPPEEIPIEEEQPQLPPPNETEVPPFTVVPPAEPSS